MRIAEFIARRSTLSAAGRDGRRISKAPAIGVAVSAVALSVAVMLGAFAVVAGFKQQITDKIEGFNAHISIMRETIEESGDDNLLTLTPTLAGILADQPYIKGYELELSVPAVLKTQEEFKGIYLRGTSGDFLSTFISEQLTDGSLPDFNGGKSDDALFVSKRTADQLLLHVGDTLPAYFINNDVQARRFVVSGIFNTHFEAYDDLIAIAALPRISEVSGVKGKRGTCIRIITDDLTRANEYSAALRHRLAEAYARGEVNIPYRVECVYNQGAGYFSWLSLLDTNVAVILVLMTVVACVTLIAAMLILIIDKIRMIGILRALGTTRRVVREIFILLALRIAIIGLLIGNAVMLLLLWLQQTYHIIPLDAESYYIDFIPVKLQFWPIICLNIVIISIIFGTLLLPSWLAGRISPTRSIRYED